VTRVGVHLATGDEGELREGRVRHLASQGARAGQRFQDCVFEVQQPAPSRGIRPPRAGRRGVPPEGGTGKPLNGRGSKGSRTRAGGWRTRALMSARWAGSPPDGDARCSIDSAYRRILGSRVQASVSGSRWATATAGCPEVHEVQGLPCRVYRREWPNPESWWRKLWRVRIPGEHRRTTSTWPRGGSLRNGLPGGARLRSGRAGRQPVSPVCTEGVRYVRRAFGHVEATGLATARNPRPRLMRPDPPPGGFAGQRARRERRKRSWISREHCAGDGRTRTHKEAGGPRERVRLLGKGKLCREAPGARAAWKKAAKRRGPRQTAGSSDSDTRRVLAGTVERGKNPEDGTDEGLATLVPRGLPRGGLRRRRGTRRRGVRGSKNPTRGSPAKLWNDTSPFGGAGRRRGTRVEADPGTLKRHRTPRGQIVGLTFCDKAWRGIPRGRASDVGGAPEANKALLAGH